MLHHVARRPITIIVGDECAQASLETEKKVPLIPHPKGQCLKAIEYQVGGEHSALQADGCALEPSSRAHQLCGLGASPSLTLSFLLGKTETLPSSLRYRKDAGKMLSTELITHRST